MKKYFIKSILLTAFIFLGLSAVLQTVHAQYANSWINYNNVYAKFKVYKEGIYRITKAQLTAANMASATGNQLAVFREGQEVPIYVSATGALGANDYIEFYATKSNSKM